MCAKSLFKNLPVRKQYHSMVKKKKEDLKNVENLLVSYGVILPKVRFSLRHNKEMIWQKVAMENTAAVLQSILGKGVVSQMEWNRKVVEDLHVSALFPLFFHFLFVFLSEYSELVWNYYKIFAFLTALI